MSQKYKEKALLLSMARMVMGKSCCVALYLHSLSLSPFQHISTSASCSSFIRPMARILRDRSFPEIHSHPTKRIKKSVL